MLTRALRARFWLIILILWLWLSALLKTLKASCITPHVQSTFVKSGRFRFTVDGAETEVGPGDSFVIPGDVVHGCVCLEPGTLIDSFTPRRDDFL